MAIVTYDDGDVKNENMMDIREKEEREKIKKINIKKRI